MKRPTTKTGRLSSHFASQVAFATSAAENDWRGIPSVWPRRTAYAATMTIMRIPGRSPARYRRSAGTFWSRVPATTL